MATMPKGRPRSVPDLAGEAYDAAMRRLRGLGDDAMDFVEAGVSAGKRGLNAVGESLLVNSAPVQMAELGRQAAGAGMDFRDNRQDMIDAGWIGGDKYFHCKANCEAAQRGPVGVFAAEKLSNLREIYGQRVKGDSRADAMADQQANRFGRTGGAASPTASCRSVCQSHRPPGLPARY